MPRAGNRFRERKGSPGRGHAGKSQCGRKLYPLADSRAKQKAGNFALPAETQIRNEVYLPAALAFTWLKARVRRDL